MKKNIVRAGFTLTELMAVVIIVAILAGIAAGSYKKAVERSRYSDGLVAATSMMESVNRYYLNNDDLDDDERTRPTIAQADISFPNTKACKTSSAYCTKTKFFEITIKDDGSVEAVRYKGSDRGDYGVRVYSDVFGSNQRADKECIYYNKTGKDICVSLGYGCGTSMVCSKI